jgi:hypothetical protein
MNETYEPLDLYLGLADIAADLFSAAAESLDEAGPPEREDLLRSDAESCGNAFAVFGGLLSTVYGRHADAALVARLTALLPERLPFDRDRLLERLTGTPHQLGNGPRWETRERRELDSWFAHRAYVVGELAVKCLAAFLSAEPAAQPAATAVRDSLALLLDMVGCELVESDLADDKLEAFVNDHLPGEDAEVEALVAAAV